MTEFIGAALTLAKQCSTTTIDTLIGFFGKLLLWLLSSSYSPRRVADDVSVVIIINAIITMQWQLFSSTEYVYVFFEAHCSWKKKLVCRRATTLAKTAPYGIHGTDPFIVVTQLVELCVNVSIRYKLKMLPYAALLFDSELLDARISRGTTTIRTCGYVKSRLLGPRGVIVIVSTRNAIVASAFVHSEIKLTVWASLQIPFGRCCVD